MNEFDNLPQSEDPANPYTYSSVPTPAPMKHSGLGITSFVMALVVGIGTFVTIIVAGVMEASQPGGMDETDPKVIAIGLVILGFIALAMLGFVLGIAAIFQRDRQKLFGILGTTLNALIVLCVVGLMILGIMMGA